MVGPSELFVIAVTVAGWALVVAFPAWRVVSRMGYPGPMGLLVAVPLVNVLLLWYVAFAAWPRDRHHPASGGQA